MVVVEVVVVLVVAVSGSAPTIWLTQLSTIPSTEPASPGMVQPPAFLLALAIAAEVVTLAAGRPGAPLSRLLLGGGRWLQRVLTTAEPSAAEQAVGCRALLAALEEHARLEVEAGATEVPRPAVAIAA